MAESKSHSNPPEGQPKPSLRVVERIAEAERIDPAEVRPPLHDVVDSGALDRLFESSSSADATRRGSVSFRYRGYDVTVHSDGRVVLE